MRFEGVASPSSKQNRETQIEREKDTDTEKNKYRQRKTQTHRGRLKATKKTKDRITKRDAKTYKMTETD
jgi:hypothetical protein